MLERCAEWRTSRSNFRRLRVAMWRFGVQDFLVDLEDRRRGSCGFRSNFKDVRSENFVVWISERSFYR